MHVRSISDLMANCRLQLHYTHTHTHTHTQAYTPIRVSMYASASAYVYTPLFTLARRLKVHLWES